MSQLAEQIEEVRVDAESAIDGASDADSLYQVQVQFLGRKGRLTAILRGLKDLDADERREVGQVSNRVKKALEERLAARKKVLEAAAVDAALASQRIDPTQPGPPRVVGREHPLARIMRDLGDLFESMGFSVVDGPEVETEFYNFEALNIPSWHPARDMQDTIWVEGGNVLRTHTSGMQIRAMQRFGAPLRVVGIGRVFRHEQQDASHEHTFHQIEGLVVDEGISVGHLEGVLDTLLEGIFGRKVVSRLRPFYFPFVEPGLELDFQCLLCDGAGCTTCKRTGWIELLGCGMVHPKVLEAGGVDPERYTGFAFGMGIERLTMMRHGIPDIRAFQSGDLRFLQQF